MNFIFISPDFPKSYFNFCRELKNLGINVLGISQNSYYSLSNELKESLTDFYQVNNMEWYDDVYRAVAYFASKYGKIDYIESNNILEAREALISLGYTEKEADKALEKADKTLLTLLIWTPYIFSVTEISSVYFCKNQPCCLLKHTL